MSRILEAAERLDALHDGVPSRYQAVALRFAGVLFRIDYWLSLPWACRLLGHEPEKVVSYLDYGIVDQVWIECRRCEHFLGHLPEGTSQRPKEKRCTTP